ncbi:5357_t:CDS:2 [Cetraspora pellucida]|uniref:5357_t:CDS:1 n=1 Tax=Cetraspora pellucida TaxID=1433469 RepID=A0ACA9M844_9GLOM|nr:5357_t:CDS:2 [Cetraspora pellucida]
MSEQSAQLKQYGSGETVIRVPTHNDILKCDNGLTAILQQSLSEKNPIHFMPNNVEDAFEYINNIQTYILHIYGPLINEQKARVNITGIKPFFDVIVSDNEPLSIFKTRLVKIILGAEKINKSKFGMKVVYAYLIPHEKKLLLSERVILSGYNYISDTDLPHYSYSFHVSVDNYQSLGESKLDDQNIETYSACQIGDLLNAKNDKDQPFVIEKAKSLGILEWMFNHISPELSNIEEIIK